MKIITTILFAAIVFFKSIGQETTAIVDSIKSAALETTVKKPKVLYGIASFYADKFIGRKTANGEIYSHEKLTAACNVLPLGTWIRITNQKNKRHVLVRITDRLHPKNKRLVDLSKSAAQKLGYIRSGLAQVKVEVLGKKKPL